MKYFIILFGLVFVLLPIPSLASYRFQDFVGRPPIHLFSSPKNSPTGITPDQIKKAYNLPSTGGSGTIAIIGAYDDPTLEQDLATFNDHFSLPSCTIKNLCLEKHVIGRVSKPTTKSRGWSLETALDVEWAHAIAPNARILLVTSPSPSGKNLLAAIDYARNRNDVVAISMSWGGKEFADEISLDSHFTSDHGVTFFAASGDKGNGVSWPAVSPNVVAVGGTSLIFKNENVTKELAWSGSGGGVSAYEPQPEYQQTYSIPRAKGMRAVPDVSYNADPTSGYPIYSNGHWYKVGGTSAGAPQWAAIKALGLSADNKRFYTDKASGQNSHYFKDITSGTNGPCSYYCDARKHYDYVTGLGSPQTITF